MWVSFHRSPVVVMVTMGNLYTFRYQYMYSGISAKLRKSYIIITKMDKRKLHHLWTKLRPLRTWYFLAAFLICLVISVMALRGNNLRMIQLRNAVTTADQQNGDIEGALRKLREFVYAHMNTDLASGQNAIKPPIQLKYTYDRLVAAEQARVSAATAKIYTDAQAECEKEIPNGLSGHGRVPCIQEYVSKHGVQAQAIPDALYKFDFVSPSWSPDLAGWMLVLSAIFALLFVVRLALEFLIKVELNRHT